MEDTVIQMGDMNIPLSFRFYSKHNFADVCAVWHQNRSSSHILTRQFIRSGTYQLFWWIEAFCMSTMWNERSNGHHEMWTTTTNQYHFYSIRISLYCRGLASAWKQWDSNNSAILCSFSFSRPLLLFLYLFSCSASCSLPFRSSFFFFLSLLHVFLPFVTKFRSVVSLFLQFHVFCRSFPRKTRFPALFPPRLHALFLSRLTISLWFARFCVCAFDIPCRLLHISFHLSATLITR